MRKNPRISLYMLLLLLCPLCLLGQQRVVKSWDGKGLNPHSRIRTLNLFINIIYDVNPERNPFPDNTGSWINATNEGINNEAIPTYVADSSFMNTTYVPDRLTGSLTRVLGEASFDSLQLTGDCVVINLKESRVTDSCSYSFKEGNIALCAVQYLNSQGGLRTVFGHDSSSHYSLTADGRLLFVLVFFRNITKEYGGLDCGSGFSQNSRLGSLAMKDTFCILKGNCCYQCIGNGDIGANPTNVVCHEVSHNLFGDNSFHASGGNHRGGKDSSRMPFLTLQGGYGLMGCANSSLVCCNGYERWRMHWKHPDAPDYITARDSANGTHVLSDIGKADGNKVFRLRDFITYGDAVRIRLPYTDGSACSNQYIWLENHCIGQNGKLDFLQHAEHPCRPVGSAGIYAYYQIGKDVLTDTLYGAFSLDENEKIWPPHERDNLRLIPAEGYFDYQVVRLDSAQYYLLGGGGCVDVQRHSYYHVRTGANPYNGYNDCEYQFHPDADADTLKLRHEYAMWRKVVGNDTNDSLAFLGDERDAFSVRTKIGMATNPSTCNAKVYYNLLKENGYSDYDSREHEARNVRTTYLSGLSIDMEPLPDSTFLVRVRWDDYHMEGDIRWTGRVVLKEEAELGEDGRIVLTQNCTPEQPIRDSMSGCFAPTSLFVCEGGSRFRMQARSRLALERQSRVRLENGSVFETGDSVEVRIGSGCVFEAQNGAEIRMGKNARFIVDSGGVLLLKNTSFFHRKAHVRVRPGGKLTADGATLTRLGDSLWTGIIVEGQSDRSRTEQEQGTVILKNNTILSDAECALQIGERIFGYGRTVEGDWRTFDWYVFGGGIVHATNTQFINNQTAVIFASYDHSQSVFSLEFLAKSYFRECVFSIDERSCFPANKFTAHVLLDGVKDPIFRGCQFSDERSELTNNTIGCGIKAFRSGVEMDAYTTHDGQTFVENTFRNFRTAIFLQNSCENASSIRNTNFYNNMTGVHALGSHHLACVSNNFIVQNPFSGAIGYACGILLEQSWAFTIQNNSFLGESQETIGIQVLSSGSNANDIRDNSFHSLCVGILVSGNNADISSDTSSKGLTASCNLFHENNSDLYIRENAVLATSQGSESHAAGNVFQFSASNISKNNGQRMFYFYNSSDAEQIPVVITGNANSVDTISTENDDCSGFYGILSGNDWNTIPFPELEQLYIDAKQQYWESQTHYFDLFPSSVLDGTDLPPEQIFHFASLQRQSMQLTEFCGGVIRRILSESVFDRDLYLQWLDYYHSPHAFYAILEDSYKNDIDAFCQQTAVVPEMYASLDHTEFLNMVSLYNIRKPADSSGCGWMNLSGSAISSIGAIAFAENYAGAIAKSVLNTYYGENFVYGEEHPAFHAVDVGCLRRSGDSTQTDSTVRKVGQLPEADTDTRTAADTLPERASYQSFFGKNKTEFHMVYPVTCYTLPKTEPTEEKPIKIGCCNTDNWVFRPENAKEFHGVRYMKECAPCFTTYEAYLREDTVLGRLYRYYPRLDTEVLFCDMSLRQGDTFWLPFLRVPVTWDYQDAIEYLYWEMGKPMVADTVFYLNGRKHIRFAYLDVEESFFLKGHLGVAEHNHIPLAFIEGIGPTYGVGNIYENLPILLCVHKDDTLAFMMNEATGCWLTEAAVPESETKASLSLSPNPAQDFLIVRNHREDDLGGTLLLTDVLGNVLLRKTMNEAEALLDLQAYSKGSYFIRYLSPKGTRTLKFIKR